MPQELLPSATSVLLEQMHVVSSAFQFNSENLKQVRKIVLQGKIWQPYEEQFT